MIYGMFLLFLLLFIGETISSVLHLPIPGNVIGMLLLTGGLVTGIIKASHVKAAANALVSNMALFFVPSGVGLMLYFDLIAREWLPITVSLLIGTLSVVIATGFIQSRMEKRGGGHA